MNRLTKRGTTTRRKKSWNDDPPKKSWNDEAPKKLWNDEAPKKSWNDDAPKKSWNDDSNNTRREWNDKPKNKWNSENNTSDRPQKFNKWKDAEEREENQTYKIPASKAPLQNLLSTKFNSKNDSDGSKSGSKSNSNSSSSDSDSDADSWGEEVSAKVKSSAGIITQASRPKASRFEGVPITVYQSAFENQSKSGLKVILQTKDTEMFLKCIYVEDYNMKSNYVQIPEKIFHDILDAMYEISLLKSNYIGEIPGNGLTQEELEQINYTISVHENKDFRFTYLMRGTLIAAKTFEPGKRFTNPGLVLQGYSQSKAVMDENNNVSEDFDENSIKLVNQVPILMPQFKFLKTLLQSSKFMFTFRSCLIARVKDLTYRKNDPRIYILAGSCATTGMDSSFLEDPCLGLLQNVVEFSDCQVDCPKRHKDVKNGIFKFETVVRKNKETARMTCYININNKSFYINEASFKAFQFALQRFESLSSHPNSKTLAMSYQEYQCVRENFLATNGVVIGGME